MRRIFTYIFSLIVLALAAGVLFLNADRANAQVPDCDISVTKSAPDAGSTVFAFSGRDENGETFSFFLRDGQETGGGVDEGTTTVITEHVTPGWVYGGIECESGPGVVITNNESGFSIECNDAEVGNANCVINNVRGTTTGIPTLSEWGMIAAAAGLGLVGVFFAVRKRRALAS